MSSSGSPEGQDQRKLLEDAKVIVASEAFQMKRSLDGGKLMDAIKHASGMVSELRTSLLAPPEYYALYMETFDELRHLEAYLYDEREKHGKKMSELYELVQYAGNIVPRLYLLITVASAYIRSKEAPVKDILRDLVEMCKGVQHPTRGLFLRNYLSEMTKDKLPDIGSDPADGSVQDSVEFVLDNFAEMNKLWVRLHMGPMREREKREKQRMALRTLVGKNLSQINTLEGVDVDLYQSTILPRILEQVIGCHDRLAQQYLMEIIVQIFPDEFHLATLDQLLPACRHLVPNVDLQSILSSLINRLANFIEASPSSCNASEVFASLEDAIQSLATELPATDETSQGDKELAAAAAAVAATGPGAVSSLGVAAVASVKPRLVCSDYLSLQAAHEQLCLRCFPQQPQFVSKILGNCCAYLQSLSSSAGDEGPEAAAQPAASQEIVSLLKQPIRAYNDVLRALALENYRELGDFLALPKRKSVQTAFLQNLVEHGTALTSVEAVTGVYGYLGTLLHDEEGQESGKIEAREEDEEGVEDFVDEQNLVAASIHLIKTRESGDAGTEALLRMYHAARKAFGVGGKRRLCYTMPPLVFCTLRALRRPLGDDAERLINGGLKFVNEIIRALQTSGFAELALKLYLEAGITASRCGHESNAYDFVSEALGVYEEDIVDSTPQFNAMQLVIGSVYSLQVSAQEKEAYETLTTKCAKHSGKLMKKPDQCRAVSLSAHLFWRFDREGKPIDVARDASFTLKCLQKAFRCADSTMSSTGNVSLFIELLNKFLYFFAHGNAQVEVKYINSIVQMINSNLATLDPNAPEAASVQAYYRATLDYINQQKARQAAHPSSATGELPFSSIEI